MAGDTTPRIVVGTSNPVANSATVLAEIVKNPGKPFVLTESLPVDPAHPEIPPVTTRRSAVEFTSTYQFILVAVIVITFISLIGYFFTILTTPSPTPDQKQFISLLDFLVKTGFGTFVGLLGGKSL